MGTTAERKNRTRRSDAGETLVEVLATIVILGGALSAVVGGLGTTVLSSVRHREQANANTLLRSYAEAVKRTARTGYVNCATTYTIAANTYVRPAGFAIPTNTVSTPQGCPGGDRGLQKVTITVTTPNTAVKTLEIWVRRT